MGVVIYHLWPNALPGGFVGVDVFFVISGFLITSLLLAEARASGRLSLTRFWARRIRRILPAAFTVLFGCVLIVVMVMPRVTWRNNLADIRAAAAYYVNWQLGAHAVNYLASSNSPTVVQHFWSLSVEEQFYLLWPLLVVCGVWLSRRAFRSHQGAALAAILGVVTAGSFAASVIWTARQPAMAFFATPTRAWEFAVGGLVAVALSNGRTASGTQQRAMSVAGSGVVLASMVLISRHDAFPGAIAALPVAGAALVIAAGCAAPASGRRIGWMRLGAVQWTGNNSYSIYLWHWPLIIAAPWVVRGTLRWPGKVVILVASLVLAAISKRLVEDPVRAGGFWRSRRWPAYSFAVAGVVAVLAVTAGFAADVGRSQHRAELAAHTRSAVLVSRPHARSCFGAAAMIPANRCRRPFARPPHLDTAFAASDGLSDPCLQPSSAPATPEYCVFGARRHPRQIVAVIGNSHAWRLIPALALYAQHHHWEVIEADRVNCLGLITAATGPDGATASCLSWGAQVEQHLLTTQGLTGVVFAGYRYWQEFTAGPHPTAAEVDATRQQVLAMWRRYQARHIRVFAVQDVPGMRPTLDPECIQQSRVRYDPCAVPASRVIRPTLVGDLAQQYPSLATYVPIDQYFCSAGRCHALIGGVVVYFDQQHVSTTFARSLAQPLGSEIAAGFATGRESCSGRSCTRR
jgi:peptidoglycan/LPS O-acetylase OafA/YrhL